MKVISPDELINPSKPLIWVSHWIEISQQRINAFAETTCDNQFIHTDPERAKNETDFGGTIAHGFLTLSLLSTLIDQSVPKISGSKMGINYGFEKIRFLVPVKSGKRIRARFELNKAEWRKPNELLKNYQVTVEIEDGDKPALVASWLSLSIIEDHGNQT